MSNRKCWAECLGDCSDKRSGEHIVTKGLFNEEVYVQGLSWCKEPKRIGINSLTKNILCRDHNTKLSAVDDAAIAAFEVLREHVRLTSVREQMTERHWTRRRLKIGGDKLERWFLKTLINLAVGGKQKIGPSSTVAGEPSCDLVEIAFGKSKFTGSAGLYNSGEVGEKIDSDDRVTIVSFFDRANEFVLGAVFHFRGFRFMLALDETGFPGNVTVNHQDGQKTTIYAKPLRHLKAIRVLVGPSQKYLSHSIDFKWT
jgi:hypothetical protein